MDTVWIFDKDRLVARHIDTTGKGYHGTFYDSAVNKDNL
jgi:hypothetical protein